MYSKVKLNIETKSNTNYSFSTRGCFYCVCLIKVTEIIEVFSHQLLI